MPIDTLFEEVLEVLPPSVDQKISSLSCPPSAFVFCTGLGIANTVLRLHCSAYRTTCSASSADVVQIFKAKYVMSGWRARAWGCQLSAKALEIGFR